jgi:type I restriction enzyme R subunit
MNDGPTLQSGLFTEDDLEQAIIQLFKSEHYEYVLGDNIHRKLDDIIIEDDINAFLNSKYANESLTNTEKKKIVSILEK